MLGIFAVFVEDSTQPRYGLEIAREAGLSHTTIYDTLARLETTGWLHSEWEHADPRVDRRPRRRLYKLTGLGEGVAQRALENQLQSLQRARTSMRWAPEPSGATQC